MLSGNDDTFEAETRDTIGQVAMYVQDLKKLYQDLIWKASDTYNVLRKS